MESVFKGMLASYITLNATHQLTLHSESLTLYENWTEGLLLHPYQMTYFQLKQNGVNSVALFCDTGAAMLEPDDFSKQRLV